MDAETIKRFLEASVKLESWLNDWPCFESGNVAPINTAEGETNEANEQYVADILNGEHEVSKSIYDVSDEIIVADGDSTRVTVAELQFRTERLGPCMIYGANAHRAGIVAISNCASWIGHAQHDGCDIEEVPGWLRLNEPANSEALTVLAMKIERERALFKAKYGDGGQGNGETPGGTPACGRNGWEAALKNYPRRPGQG